MCKSKSFLALLFLTCSCLFRRRCLSYTSSCVEWNETLEMQKRNKLTVKLEHGSEINFSAFFAAISILRCLAIELNGNQSFGQYILKMGEKAKRSEIFCKTRIQENFKDRTQRYISASFISDVLFFFRKKSVKIKENR